MDLAQLLSSLSTQTGGCGCSDETSAGSVLTVRSHYRGRVESPSGARPSATSTVDRRFAINFAQEPLAKEAVELAARDARLISERISKHQDAVLQLALDFRSGNLDGAIRIAREIGLTEESLQRDGGGFWGLVVLLAAIIVIASAERTSDLADPPPPPKGPVDVPEAQVNDVMGLVGKHK